MPRCDWYLPFLSLYDTSQVTSSDSKKITLAKAFVGIDARGKRRGITDFKGDEAFPLWF